ncbi:MAG TPA: hypothetical protein VF677_09010 [Flavobacterium sp.]|jgi:hypothetical protein
MKNLFAIIILLLVPVVCIAQNENFPKASFTGKWERVQRFHNLSLEIKFEKGKDYATVVDVGTGEAPPIILHAKMQGNKLIILPQQVNDHIEMEIKNRKLIFSYQPVVWDKYEKPLLVGKNGFIKKVYKRVK